MAYFATFTSGLIAALQAGGLTAVRAFPQTAVQGTSVGTEANRIVTVAIEKAAYEAPIAYRDGVAFPVRLTVRFGFYVPCTESTAALETLCDNEVVPTLVANDYDVRSVVLGEPTVCKAVNRLTASALVTINGLVTRTPLTEGGDA